MDEIDLFIGLEWQFDTRQRSWKKIKDFHIISEINIVFDDVILTLGLSRQRENSYSDKQK
jgi:hypothetical protein